MKWWACYVDPADGSLTRIQADKPGKLEDKINGLINDSGGGLWLGDFFVMHGQDVPLIPNLPVQLGAPIP